MSIATSDIKQDIETLKARINTLSDLFAQEVDIHTHTRQIGPHYQYFNAIDQKYNLSSNTQKLEEVIKQILARCPAKYKQNITTVLNTIRATTRPDNETQANLQELLIRTWSLVNMPNNYSNSFDIFIQNLDHNIATGGGCVPGIAARLIQPYTHFVLRMLQQIPVSQKVPEKTAPIAARQATEEELIQQAIAASLADMPITETKVHQKSAAQTAARRKRNEDAALKLALAASLQDATPAPVAPKPQAPKEQPSAVRMVFSNQATALKGKPPAPTTNNAPAADKKTQSEADRIREARLKHFGDGKKK